MLTTEVINWARTSVRECDLARRLVHYAITEKTVTTAAETMAFKLPRGLEAA